MNHLEFIKGKSYFIDGFPHFYQGQENGGYKFLKCDGSQRYLNEAGLDKVKPSREFEEYEEKLRAEKEKSKFYMDKYYLYKSREEENKVQEKYKRTENDGWFSNNKYVQVSALLTMILVIIGAIKVVSNVPNFGSGAFTFIVLLIGGLIISFAVAWFAYKLIGVLDIQEEAGNVIVPLLFYLPAVWFVLYRVLLFLFSLNQDTE